MALFMYPHSVTAVLATKGRDVGRRNAALLPAYSLLLGLIALLGYMALAAKVKPIGLDGKPNAQLAVPQLFENLFPSWFAGIAYSAIAIGALVPAAIMSIAAANLFTRNIYREFLRPAATPAQEARQLPLEVGERGSVWTSRHGRNATGARVSSSRVRRRRPVRGRR